MTETTTIQISLDTKKALEEEKIIERETWDAVIQRLLAEHAKKEEAKEFAPSPEMRKVLESAVQLRPKKEPKK